MKCCNKDVTERFCPTCGEITIEQNLLWIPEIKKGPVRFMRELHKAPFDGKTPKHIWTLFLNRDKNKRPILPIVPIHHKNAFMEDKMHDWNIIFKGKNKRSFEYYSNCMDKGGMWILLEFDKETKGEVERIMDEIKDNDMLKDIIYLLPESIFETDAYIDFQMGLEDSIEKHIRKFFNNESD